MMEKSEDLPKSSQPATGMFLEVYDQLSEDGSAIISIHTIKAVGIAHVDAFDLASKLKQAILEISPNCIVDISFTTPVISTHTGRGAIGFMFLAE